MRSNFATAPSMRLTYRTFSTNSMWFYASPIMPTDPHPGRHQRATFTCAVMVLSGRYHGSYSGRMLKRWAEVMLTWKPSDGTFSDVSITTKKLPRRAMREGSSN